MSTVSSRRKLAKHLVTAGRRILGMSEERTVRTCHALLCSLLKEKGGTNMYCLQNLFTYIAQGKTKL